MSERIIPLNQLRIDSNYQRSLKEDQVRKIVKEWDDMRANLIHVSHREDGFYYVIDGNHTRVAAERVGKKDLLCRVYEGLSVKEEAKLFAELNKAHKNPSYSEMLKARAVAGYEKEKEYLQALEEADIPYTLSGGGSTSKQCIVRCHSAMFSVYKRTTFPTMVRALLTAKKSANDRPEFYQSGFFPGLCDLVVVHPEINDSHLIENVRKTPFSKIADASEIYKRGLNFGQESRTACFRRAYVDIYNKGLRNNKIKED